ncbi:TatD family hydrolase [archaeon]|jgi:TatD DNase family protein|nr:TatD family hydrolase [archaeon]MBT4647020.1 TatD family hydrolase [archaeon]MBT6822458.1 TatD family hydrolase [archaeon]MBT7391987.1 TatD family hydrolase [archaeon]
MILVDVHTHLDFFDESELDSLIERAKNVGLKSIITQGTNPESNRNSLEISKKYDVVKLAMGIYPDEAMKLSDEKINDEIKFIQDNKKNIIAIGEVGLDYKGEKTEEDIKKQKHVFLEMINIAKKLKIPVIVHSRNAEKDCIEMLEESKHNKIIMHCFGGNHKLVEKIRQLGWSFSVPTNCVRNEHFQKLIKETPIKQLLSETDAPYLSPFKDKRNEPSYIIETIKIMAKLKELDETETANMIYKNYQDMFL